MTVGRETSEEWTQEISDDIRAEAAELSAQHAAALIALGTSEREAVQQGTEVALRHARDRVTRIRMRRNQALSFVADAYRGHIDRMLDQLGRRLGIALAYIDRATVESHLGRSLLDAEWAAVSPALAGLGYDDYLSELTEVRSTWIDRVLRTVGGITPDPGEPHEASR